MFLLTSSSNKIECKIFSLENSEKKGGGFVWGGRPGEKEFFREDRGWEWAWEKGCQ